MSVESDAFKTADQDRRDALDALARGGTKALADTKRAVAEQAATQQAAINQALANASAANAPGGVPAQLSAIIAAGAKGPRDYIPKIGSLTGRYIKGVRGTLGEYLGTASKLGPEITKQLREEEARALLEAMTGDGGGGGGGGGGGWGGGGGRGGRGGGGGGGRGSSDPNDWRNDPYYAGGWKQYFGTSKSQGGMKLWKDFYKNAALTGVDPDTLEKLNIGRRVDIADYKNKPLPKGATPTSIRRQQAIQAYGEPGVDTAPLGLFPDNPFITKGLSMIDEILSGKTREVPSVKKFMSFARQVAQDSPGNNRVGVRWLTTQYAKARKDALARQKWFEGVARAQDQQRIAELQSPQARYLRAMANPAHPHPRGYAGKRPGPG